MLNIIGWSVFGYLFGGIPFAYLIGRFFAKKDIRLVGDGNPGGSNVWIAGGWRAGLLAAVVDIFKGYLPITLARRAGLSDWWLVPICLAPILGHATQPFLGLRGGKALGATGGVWVALIGLRTFPIYASFTLPALALQAENAYSALAGMLALLGYAILVEGSPWLITFAVLNILLLTFTHRKNLGRPLQLRSWVTNLFARGSAP